jgi:hypothetical protein
MAVVAEETVALQPKKDEVGFGIVVSLRSVGIELPASFLLQVWIARCLMSLPI